VDQSINLDAELERRLALVERPENEGEELRGQDYAALFAVTILGAAVLMVIAWFA
jgi:hypothetical protein